jgi:hypothetical protein
MWFDLMSYPGWLATALGIGLVVGWRTYSDAPRRGLLDGWIKWGALVFVIGVIVAVLKLVPGRYGLWLEIALLMTALYVVGCFLGGWLKELMGAHEITGAARAAVDRLAAEAAAKAEAQRRAAAGAKAEAGRLAAGVSAKVEPERKVVMAETDRQARRLPRRGRQRLLPLPRRRRIVLQRKQKPKLDERLLRVPKPRRIVRLQRLPRRPRLTEKLPPRPRRIVWLQRLPRGPKSNDRLIMVASPRRLRRPMEGRTISR